MESRDPAHATGEPADATERRPQRRRLRAAPHVAGRRAHVPGLAAHRSRGARPGARRRPAAAGAHRRLARRLRPARRGLRGARRLLLFVSAPTVPSAARRHSPPQRPLPERRLGDLGAAPPASVVLACRRPIVLDLRGGVSPVSHYAPSRELVVEICRTLLERGYLKATEGNVSVRVPGEDAYAITPSSYDYGKMEPGDICVLGLDGRHILGAKKASIEVVDARGRVRAARRRERDHPHAPAVRERARADGAADPRPVRRTGALPRPLGRARLVRPVGDELPQEERGEEARQRRQRVHPREPRRARARRRRRAGRAQHGAAREGRARLPARAAHRRARREGAAAHPRDRLPEAAQGREEAGGARSRRRARRARPRRRAPPRRRPRKRRGRPQASPRPRRSRRAVRAPASPAPPAPSSPATPSAAIRTSPTSTGGWATSSPSPSARSVATSWTATSPGSTRTAAAARS